MCGLGQSQLHVRSIGVPRGRGGKNRWSFHLGNWQELVPSSSGGTGHAYRDIAARGDRKGRHPSSVFRLPYGRAEPWCGVCWLGGDHV